MSRVDQAVADVLMAAATAGAEYAGWSVEEIVDDVLGSDESNDGIFVDVVLRIKAARQSSLRVSP